MRNKPPKKRLTGAATVLDVAAYAGTSAMTVSRVVNGKMNVKKDVRDSVLKAVQKLNYQPNLAARSLAGTRSKRIGLIYSNSSSAYLSELLVGVLAGVRQASAHVCVESWRDYSSSDMRAAIGELGRNVDGVIIPSPLCESKAVITELLAAKMPVLAIGSRPFQAPLPCVRIDDFQAAFDLTNHLLKYGHIKIAFIAGHPSQHVSERRLAGYKSAISESGLTVDPALIKQGPFSHQSGLQTAENLLSGKNLPTAVFASNDDMAIAIINAAHRKGLNVPTDLSVVGFDDTTTANTSWPGLTAIYQPIATMAEVAVELLMQNIRSEKSAAELMYDHVIAYQLISRESVTTPPATVIKRKVGKQATGVNFTKSTNHHESTNIRNL